MIHQKSKQLGYCPNYQLENETIKLKARSQVYAEKQK